MAKKKARKEDPSPHHQGWDVNRAVAQGYVHGHPSRAILLDADQGHALHYLCFRARYLSALRLGPHGPVAACRVILRGPMGWVTASLCTSPQTAPPPGEWALLFPRRVARNNSCVNNDGPPVPVEVHILEQARHGARHPHGEVTKFLSDVLDECL